MYDPFSYGYNGFVCNVRSRHNGEPLGLGSHDFTGGQRNNYHERRASTVRKATEMIAVGDSGDANYSTVAHSDFELVAPRVYPPDARHCGDTGQLHRSGANILFCDGHVQWYRREDLVVNGSTGKGWRIAAMWNFDHQP